MMRKDMPNDLIGLAESIVGIIETALADFKQKENMPEIDDLFTYLKLNETLRVTQYAITQLETLRKYLVECDCE